MLSNFYSPHALPPQFHGLPGGGLSHMNPAYFSQPGAFGGISPGYDLGHAAAGHYPFGGLTSPFLGYSSFPQSQFSQGPFGQGPFAALNPLAMLNPGAGGPSPYPQSQVNPYLPGQSGLQGQPGLSPFGSPFTHGQSNSFGGQQDVSQIVPALVQLAQQISAQSVITQQIGIALYQFVQQLAAQSAHAWSGAGMGAGQSPFATSGGGYPGFGQTQGWGANRPQTIQ